MKLILAFAILFANIAHADVRNPSLFIGEVVTGGTPSTGLYIDANNKLASGSAPVTNAALKFTANITTTSTTDVVLTGMTTTPAAGTYLVTFSTWLTHSNGNATVTMSIFAGGAQAASTARTTLPFSGAVGSANNGLEAGTNGIVTVNGSQAIALEWHTSTGTATAHAGELDIVRVQ